MAYGTDIIGTGAAKELASVSTEARTNNILGFIFGVLVAGDIWRGKNPLLYYNART
jgi:hypothetical protein